MSFRKDYIAMRKHTNSNIKPLFKIHLWVMFFFRISHFFYKIKLIPVSRLFWMINRVLFSIDIDPRASFKGGVVIIHGIGLVIGRFVISEGDFVVYHGVTLGGNNNKERKYNNIIISQPVIKHNSIIGINAIIIGPVIIGENSRIGANAVITKDVPPNSTAISNNKILNEN